MAKETTETKTSWATSLFTATQTMRDEVNSLYLATIATLHTIIAAGFTAAIEAKRMQDGKDFNEVAAWNDHTLAENILKHAVLVPKIDAKTGKQAQDSKGNLQYQSDSLRKQFAAAIIALFVVGIRKIDDELATLLATHENLDKLTQLAHGFRKPHTLVRSLVTATLLTKENTQKCYDAIRASFVKNASDVGAAMVSVVRFAAKMSGQKGTISPKQAQDIIAMVYARNTERAQVAKKYLENHPDVKKADIPVIVFKSCPNYTWSDLMPKAKGAAAGSESGTGNAGAGDNA